MSDNKPEAKPDQPEEDAETSVDLSLGEDELGDLMEPDQDFASVFGESAAMEEEGVFTSTGPAVTDQDEDIEDEFEALFGEDGADSPEDKLVSSELSGQPDVQGVTEDQDDSLDMDLFAEEDQAANTPNGTDEDGEDELDALFGEEDQELAEQSGQPDFQEVTNEPDDVPDMDIFAGEDPDIATSQGIEGTVVEELDELFSEDEIAEDSVQVEVPEQLDLQGMVITQDKEGPAGKKESETVSADVVSHNDAILKETPRSTGVVRGGGDKSQSGIRAGNSVVDSKPALELPSGSRTSLLTAAVAGLALLALITGGTALWMVFDMPGQILALRTTVAESQSKPPRANKAVLKDGRVDALLARVSNLEVRAEELAQETGKPEQELDQRNRQAIAGLNSRLADWESTVEELKQQLGSFENVMDGLSKRVEDLGKATAIGGSWSVNIASYARESLADLELVRLQGIGVEVMKRRVKLKGRNIYRLSLHGFPDYQAARSFAHQLRVEKGIGGAWPEQVSMGE